MKNCAIRNAYSKSLNASAYSVIAAVAFCLSPLAQAQSLLVAAPWLVGVSVGGVTPESLRSLSTGGYARAFVSIPLRPQAYIDASVFATKQPGKNSAPDEKTLGLGLDLHLESLGNRAKYVFLAGGGYSHAERGGGSLGAPYINIGYGIDVSVTDRLSLRPEVRGIARFSDEFIANRGVTYDAAFSLGLVHSFGAVPKTSTRSSTAYVPPPAPSVAARDAAPPAAGFYEVAPSEAPISAPRVETASQARVFAGGPCPRAPAGAAVDGQGCLVVQKLTLPRSAFFGAEGTRLSAGSDAAIEAVAAAMFYNPGASAVITVHTDSLGYAEDNLSLTETMAEDIRTELIARGVTSDRIEAIGRGESRPVANEDTDAGIEKNRRVEIDLKVR